jgi:hypothetical protein
MWMIGIFGAALTLVVGRFVLGNASTTSWTEHAVATGDLDSLIEHIEASPSGEHPTKWDQAIKALWQSYNRETAARLVIESAKRCDAPIIQYWIRQVLEVEPELAARHFSEEFLAQHFRPDVAARCGKSCGCG